MPQPRYSFGCGIDQVGDSEDNISSWFVEGGLCITNDSDAELMVLGLSAITRLSSEITAISDLLAIHRVA